MESPATHFADTVREFIILNDMTPTSFARKIGCLERCVARWLNGTNTPSLEYVLLVADFMNCSVDYLFGKSEKPEFTPAVPRAAFPERLVLLMKQTNINKNRLAAISGVTSSTVSKWILHGQLPKPDVICTLADFFNCSVDYLTGRSNFI